MADTPLVAREKIYAPILVKAFMGQGLPPAWAMAFAYWESRFTPTALNNTGGDALRGGSRGLCQMSWRTAVGLGYAGQPSDLFDPQLNAALAAKLCKQLTVQFKTRELREIASGYNSGKPFAKAPLSTRTVYAPGVVQAAAVYQVEADIIAKYAGHMTTLPTVISPLGI